VEIAFQDGSGAFTSIHVDATIRESHNTSSQVTEHPVEQGANVSDHVRPELEKLTLEVFITNTPIRLPKSHVSGVLAEIKSLELPRSVNGALGRGVPRRAGPPMLTGPYIPPQRGPLGQSTPAILPEWSAAQLIDVLQSDPSVSVLQFSAEFDRVRTLYNELRRLVTGGTLCRILTGLREYENMVIKGMDTPRENAEGSAITVTLDVIQVRIVTTETVEVPKQVRARKPKPKGNQPPTAVVPKKETKDSLASLATGFGIKIP
jgi:hypothetical protein